MNDDPFLPDEKPSPPEPEKDRPLIVYERAAGHESVHAALPPLVSSGRVYVRSYRLVQILHSTDANLCDDIRREGSAPVISEIPIGALWEIVSECSAWGRWDGRLKKNIPIEPPAVVLRALHARGHWEGMPDLRGISTVPILRPDGSVSLKPGYDSQSQLFYAPNCPEPLIPGNPTRDDARDALERLLAPVVDFPFAEPYHRSAWLSSVLSRVASPGFEGGVPMTMIDANTPGTGKTLLADVASIISTGLFAARSPYVKDDDELRKRITSHLIAGDQLALIDNAPSGSVIGWPSLDSALTAGVWCDRELGKSVRVRVPMECIWFVTGNNLRIGGDAARRVLKVRLEAREARPEERTGFAWDPLLRRVREERPYLLGYALNAVRAYLLAGSPPLGLKQTGSFEGWNAVIRSSMVWAGLPDPAQAFATYEEGLDEEAEAHTTFLVCWEKLEDMSGGSGLTCQQILQQLGKRDDLEAMVEAIKIMCPTKDDSLPSSRSLGWVFKKLVGRIRDHQGASYRFVRNGSLHNVARWLVIKKQQELTENSPRSVLSPTQNPQNPHKTPLASIDTEVDNTGSGGIFKPYSQNVYSVLPFTGARGEKEGLKPGYPHKPEGPDWGLPEPPNDNEAPWWGDDDEKGTESDDG